MVYDPFEWQTGAEGATPITAVRLQAIENGIGDVSQEVEGRLSEASLNSTIATQAAGFASINVKSMGVVGDGVANDGPAIQAILDAYPFVSLYFPEGDYKTNQSLDVHSGNSFILNQDARVFAGAAMSILLDWTPTVVEDRYGDFMDINGNTQGKIIRGGTWDGAGLADTVMKITTQVGTILTEAVIRNGVNVGLFVDGPGAELMASKLRFVNDTDDHIADNTAIINSLQGSYFSDIIIVDWTKGVRDEAPGGASWARVHPWYTQAARLPDSVAFELHGSSHLIQCYADSARVGFDVTWEFATVHITQAVHYIETLFYTLSDLATYPAVVLKMATGARVFLTDSLLYGAAGASIPMTSGPTSRLTLRDNKVESPITGYAPYEDGTKQGFTSFTPSLIGATVAGEATYTTRIGRAYVTGKMAHVSIHLAGTLDATLTGALRISGIPTLGPSDYNTPTVVSTRTGLGHIEAAEYVASNDAISLYNLSGTNTANVSAAAVQGVTFEIRVTFTMPVAFGG